MSRIVELVQSCFNSLGIIHFGVFFGFNLFRFLLEGDRVLLQYAVEKETGGAASIVFSALCCIQHRESIGNATGRGHREEYDETLMFYGGMKLKRHGACDFSSKREECASS